MDPARPIGETLAEILRQNVQKKGVEMFRDGFNSLDALAVTARTLGWEITDSQLTEIKKALVNAVSTRRQMR